MTKEITAIKNITEIKSFQLGNLTPDQVAVIKSTVAKGASDTELQWFLYQASVLGLNPLTKEIWFIKRVKKTKNAYGKWDYPRLPNGQIDYTDADLVIMTSKDGYLKKASENPEFLSVQSMEVRENDEFQMEFDGEKMKVSKHKWQAKDRGRIIAAWAVVNYKDGTKDWNFINFDEYCQTYDGLPTGTWKTNPTAMIKKCVENPILKKAARLSGITTAEEMEHIVESDVGIINNDPEKVTVREDAIIVLLERIQGAKDLQQYEKLKEEISAKASGFLSAELEMVKKEMITKRKELETLAHN